MSLGVDSASQPRSVILLYHRVAKLRTDPYGIAVHPRRFNQHMRVLRDSGLCLPLQQLHKQLAAGKLRRSAIAVTFDDGYADNLHNALPALERHGIPATIFIASGLIDGDEEIWSDELDRILLQPGRLPPHLRVDAGGDCCDFELNGDARLGWLTSMRGRNRKWRMWMEPQNRRHAAMRALWQALRAASTSQQQRMITQLREAAGVDPRGRPTHRWLTTAELRALARSQYIEIGGHTVNHPSLGHQPEAVQQHEIRQCKATLENLLQREVSSFAYPYGERIDYSETTKSILRECRFSRACSNFGGCASDSTDEFDLRRVAVHNCSGEEFRSRLFQWLNESQAPLHESVHEPLPRCQRNDQQSPAHTH